jgi:hypothetical protein
VAEAAVAGDLPGIIRYEVRKPINEKSPERFIYKDFQGFFHYPTPCSAKTKKARIAADLLKLLSAFPAAEVEDIGVEPMTSNMPC